MIQRQGDKKSEGGRCLLGGRERRSQRWGERGERGLIEKAEVRKGEMNKQREGVRLMGN